MTTLESFDVPLSTVVCEFLFRPVSEESHILSWDSRALVIAAILAWSSLAASVFAGLSQPLDAVLFAAQRFILQRDISLLE